MRERDDRQAVLIDIGNVSERIVFYFSKYADKRFDIFKRRGFIERDADIFIFNKPEIVPLRARKLKYRHCLFFIFRFYAQRVKIHIVQLRIAAFEQLPVQYFCKPVNTGSNFPDAVGTVIHRIEAGHDRQKRLSRAYIRCRFFTPDVLLSRLKRHSVRTVVLRIDRHADDPSRHAAYIFVFDGKVPGMRPAVAERQTEPLRTADYDIRTHLAWRNKKRKCEQIGCNNCNRTCLMDFFDKLPVIGNRTVFRRILYQRAEKRPIQFHRVGITDDDFNPVRDRPRKDDIDSLTQAA